ncbi:MAG: NifU family protein [Planctomycetota bacterium]
MPVTTTPAEPAPPPGADLEEAAQRVDRAIAAADALEGSAKEATAELRSAIEQFHKAGLTHIVRTLKADPRGKELLFSLVDDPGVYALFAMHGIVRQDLTTRVRRAIERVRPYMQSHGGDVTLVEVRENKVFVRLEGSCNGCSMSSITLKKTVEETINEDVPEIDGIEVVEPAPDNLVQIAPLGAADAGWVEGPMLDEIDSERPFAFQSGDADILLIRSKKGLRAYRNACAHQGAPLDGGVLDPEAGVITCPLHGFQFDTESGECFSAPQCQLEPFPLREENGRVMVRPR